MSKRQIPLHGLIAEFEESEEVIEAAHKAYAEGYRDMDAYSPIPLHELSEAIGCTKSIVPRFVFVGGILGAIGAFTLEYGTAGFLYALNVGGRPYFSWPAFIPITFEGGILIAAFSAVISMFVLNGLPRHHHPVFGVPGFERATTDRFFLCIEATDNKFDKEATRAFLEGLGAHNVSEAWDR